MALEDKYFPSVNSGSFKHTWQGAKVRRDHAREFYDKYSSSGAVSSGIETNYSANETLSSAGNIKYDMTDNDIKTLLRFSVYEADKNGEKYEDILSSILDDYEKSGYGKKGDSDELIKYVEDKNSKFKFKNDYKAFLDDSDATNAKINSDQLKNAKSIIVDGLRTTSVMKIGVSSSNNNAKYCPDKNKGKGAARIAEVAALMSWPVQSWQTGADDYSSDRVGKCNSGNGWISYVFDSGSCMTNPRDLYRTNWNTFTGQGWYDMYEDCGYFVSTVLNYLDVADHDTKYLMSGQPTMAGAKGPGYDYSPGDLEESSDWKRIENTGENAMRPGDVLIDDGHVMLYVGQKYGGEYGTVAHASRGTRVGEISDLYSTTRWRIYRYVGTKLGSDELEGLTQEEANKLANNYNSNKGNWSGYRENPYNPKVAGYGNYCHSYECASDYSNCSLFSGFFAEMFWGAAQRTWPNGSLTVNTLAGLGYETGDEPRPFAIFSTTSFHGDDHTGVVVAIDGDKIATVEAGYPKWNATYYDFESISGHNIKFAYPKDFDYDKLMEFIER